MISIEENLGAPPPKKALNPKRIEGHLSEGSFLRECFPGGAVPLIHPMPQKCVVCGQEIFGYLLDLEKLTAKEFNAVARMTARRARANLNRVLEAMTEDKMIPMSLKHICFVAVPMGLIT